MDDILKQLLQEEQELQFTKFNEVTAWQLGNQLVALALSKELAVAIDITRGNHQLFHASLRGTSVDNDEWIKRKVRLVYRFGHSSFYMGQLLKSKGKALSRHISYRKANMRPTAAVFP